MLIDEMGGFADAFQESEDLSITAKAAGRDLTGEELDRRKTLKLEHFVPFNQAIKDAIDTNASFATTDFIEALRTTYTRLYEMPTSLSEQAMEKTLSNRVQGMKQELAAETLLEIADIPYQSAIDPSDDIEGADILVEIDGKEYPINIKSSLRAEKNAVHKNSESFAVWTGLKPDDFTGVSGDLPGSLTIPWNAARTKSAAFVERIKRTIISRKIQPKLGKIAHF